MQPTVESFFDAETSTISHVVYECRGSACAIFDPALDYDARSRRTSTACANRTFAYVRAMELQVVWLLETHVHADHISAEHYLRRRLGGQI